MQYMSGFYSIWSYMDSHNFILNSSEMMNKVENSAGSSMFYHIIDDDTKTIAANKSHSEAERRRRKRINAHLATLRTILPKTIKPDKASLLAEVVKDIRELQEKASHAPTSSTSYLDGFSRHEGSTEGGMNLSAASVFPSATDELELRYCNEDGVVVQGTLCYEDRPEIMGELTRAIKSIQGKVLRAEMATIGGRTKNVLWVKLPVGGDEGLVRLGRVLKVVLSKTDFLPGNKRHCAMEKLGLFCKN